MLFNKLISFFYKYLNIDNNYIKINNFEFEILNNSKKSESDFEITTNNDRWSYALKFQLNKNETNSFIAGIEIEITQGEIEIITTSDLDISNNKTSKRLSKGKYNEQIEINSNFKNLIFRNYYKSESKFKITSFILTKKKAFDMSNEFKEYLPLLIKDQEVNLNEIINKRNIKLQNISEFKLIKSAYEYQIDLDEIFNDTKGKVLIKNLKHKINLLEKFDYNLLPIKFKENGYGDNEYFKGFLKQSTIRVYHTLLCLDYFKMENKKVLEVGSLFGFFSSVLKDLGNDVTAFDRYNDFNGALENFCSDMKNQNINVIQSSEDKEDKDFDGFLKDNLKDKVKDVKISKRLTTSASCLVADENDMDMHLKKLMAANNQNISDEKRILEININHELVNKLKSLDKNQKDKFCEILYDHAKLMEGENLDDPKKYTNLVSELVSL